MPPTKLKHLVGLGLEDGQFIAVAIDDSVNVAHGYVWSFGTAT
jgi:hypothetical protein